MSKNSIKRWTQVLVGVLTAFGPLQVVAGPGDGYGSGYRTGIDAREYARRVDRVVQANEAYERGRAHAVKREWGEAVAEYQFALETLPFGPATEAHRNVYIDALATATVHRARELANQGKYPEAIAQLDYVLSERPNDKRAMKLRNQLGDADIYPPGYDEDHHARVEAVNQGLRMSSAARRLGKFDRAHMHAEDVLRSDRTNTAARRLMEKVNNDKSRYYRTARDHTRAKYLGDVDQAWEMPVPPKDFNPSGMGGSASGTGSITYMTTKLQDVTLPNIDLPNVNLEDAVNYLRQMIPQYDILEEGVEGGVNLVIDRRRIQNSSPDALTRSFNLTVDSVALGDVLRFVAELAGVKIKIDPHAVVFVPQSDESDQLYNKYYQVPPAFLSLGGGGGGGGEEVDVFADDPGDTGLEARPTALEVLKDQGVDFPEGAGASAFYSPQNGQLVVRNTQKQLDLVDAIVADIITKEVPSQVQIETKFVEIRQNNRKELGFDWWLGVTGINSDRALLGGGGTDNRPLTGLLGADRATALGLENVFGGGTLTDSLRSGSSAISGNIIDALIANGRINSVSDVLTKAPGVASIAGVLTDPQFEVIIRALNQKKGTDLLSAPTVTTMNSVEASVEVVRELIYPTEYDPPELPQTVGQNEITIGGGEEQEPGSIGSFPVTPATPVSFKTRNTGVTMRVTPTVGSDGYSIDLLLDPEVVDFDGFINYGSPITSAGTDLLGNPINILLTENRIEMPVFSTRKVTTAVTIWDGATVAIGGLMREDVKHTNDKVPLLGDVPLLGRLFRSEAEQREKRNLMIFVTAKLIDPAGQLIRKPPTENEDEDTEALFPPATPPQEMPVYGKGYSVK